MAKNSYSKKNKAGDRPLLKRPSFATTVNYGHDAQWGARAHPILPLLGKDPGMGTQLSVLAGIISSAFREQALLLDSSSGNLHPELLASAFIGLWPGRKPAIVLQGCMWQQDAGLKGVIQHQIVRLADRAITRYAVQSTEELTLFPQTWGVSAAKTRLCPYFFTITDGDRQTAGVVEDDFVFAGGNSHRDYLPLIEAARRLPEREFVLATNRLQGIAEIPTNVIARPVPHMEFMRLLLSARVVVVPLAQGLNRAVGQQTYLNAMLMGKPTIISNAPGVHDHVRDNETALVVDGSAQSYVDALNWMSDPGNCGKVAAMCAAAQKDVAERFTYERHVARLLAVLDEAINDAER